MSGKTSGSSTRLDLGLSEILARAEGDVPQSAQEPPVEAPPTEIISLQDGDGGLSSELLSLAEGKRWAVLVSRAEASFSSSDDVEARLWWIRGHLGAFSLPVSLLAAPFETICRHADGEARERYRRLISEIGSLMLVRLNEVGDKRQEFAVRHVLQQLGVLDSTEELRRKTPERVPNFQVTKERSSAEGPAVWPLAPMVAERRKRVPIGYIVGGLSSIAAIFYFLVGMGHESPASVASEDFISSRPALSLEVPVVRARGVVSNLGALFYSLSDTPKVGSVASVAPVSTSPAVVKGTTSPQAASAQMAPSEKPVPPPKQKEVVRTDGPVESPDFRKETRKQSAPYEARLPDPLFGRPPEPDMSSSYPDGSAVVPGRVSSVIASTDVFSSPSDRARVLGRLLVGDEVNVEGQVGRWLRIRSRKGRVGFVYSHDVGERDDFRADRAGK